MIDSSVSSNDPGPRRLPTPTYFRSVGSSLRHLSHGRNPISSRYPGHLSPFFIPTNQHPIALPEPRLRNVQLSNLLCSPSRRSIYYATDSRILSYDSVLDTAHTVLDLSLLGSPSDQPTYPSQRPTITSIATSSNVLIAGTDHGSWALRSLSSIYSTEPCPLPPTSLIHGCINTSESFATARADCPAIDYHTGSLATPHEAFDGDATTNHITIHPFRPTAILGTNRPYRLTDLDLMTQQPIATHDVPFCPHASAVSPCGRLHLVVGDDTAPLILDAHNGVPVVRLSRQTAAPTTALWGGSSLQPWAFATGNRVGEIVLSDSRFWGRDLARHRIETIKNGSGSAIHTMRAHNGNLLGSAVDGLLWSVDVNADINDHISNVTFIRSMNITINRTTRNNSLGNRGIILPPPLINLLGTTGEIAGLDILPSIRSSSNYIANFGFRRIITTDNTNVSGDAPSIVVVLTRPRIWTSRSADFWRERREGFPPRNPGFWNEGDFWTSRRNGLQPDEGLGIRRVGMRFSVRLVTEEAHERATVRARERERARRREIGEIVVDEEGDHADGADEDDAWNTHDRAKAETPEDENESENENATWVSTGFPAPLWGFSVAGASPAADFDGDMFSVDDLDM